MIELATPETARYVADHLGKNEICVLSFGREEAGRNCLYDARVSPLSFAVIARTGRPVCLFGADGLPGDEWGSAWMYSTDEVSTARFELFRGMRKAIEYSRQHWPELRISAERRSDKQKKFLEMIGFRPVTDGSTELFI